MNTHEPSEQHRTFIAATVLLMLLSVVSMLAIGLASNFESAAPRRQGPPAASRSAGTSQGRHMQALRAHVTQWVAYLSQWK